MKKLFAMLLSLAMVLSLAACGGSTTEETTTDDSATEETGDAAATSDIEVAVVLKTLSSEYWGYVKAGCDARCPLIWASRSTWLAPAPRATSKVRSL